MSHTTTRRSDVLARGAERIARWREAPTSLRALLGYYADTGVFDSSALRIKGYVDRTIEAMISDAYAEVEAAIADEFGMKPASVEFSYDTKLTMPAELTLGHVYQRAIEETPIEFDPVTQRVQMTLGSAVRLPLSLPASADRLSSYRESCAETLTEVESAEAVTKLIVEALLDGDMRDALNDAEYEDFEVSFPVDDSSRRRIGEIAQACLQNRVEEKFAHHTDDVREAYDHAVDVSEAHQDRDPRFRELARLALDGSAEGETAIREEYRDAPFEETPPIFSDRELDLPYLKTQYGRVGVIYDGMIEMYRAAGVAVSSEFKKAIVLAIIGAQIWLDDIDDFEQDVAEGQLTPVTAEYWLTASETDAYDRVVEITTRYLDLAKRYAADSDSTLTGIGIDYIFRSGDPGTLPGSDR
ncbi:MAG: hypothetical protein ACQETI_08830 [Halobacteriota archaeon]